MKPISKRNVLMVACLCAPFIGAAYAGTPEEDLMAADTAFAARAGEIGPAKALIEFAADDARWFPAGKTTVMGKADIAADVAGTPEGFTVSWKPEEAFASPSGDFGYTWGYAKVTEPGEGGAAASVEHHKYVTIWRKGADGAWKWLADIGNSAPAPGEHAMDKMDKDAMAPHKDKKAKADSPDN